jgi:hypothetical protein
MIWHNIVQHSIAYYDFAVSWGSRGREQARDIHSVMAEKKERFHRITVSYSSDTMHHTTVRVTHLSMASRAHLPLAALSASCATSITSIAAMRLCLSTCSIQSIHQTLTKSLCM